MHRVTALRIGRQHRGRRRDFAVDNRLDRLGDRFPDIGVTCVRILDQAGKDLETIQHHDIVLTAVKDQRAAFALREQIAWIEPPVSEPRRGSDA